uniref:Reverse transcriptase zinc-binding domain-containing protein n=1 Tax=Cannabis sativa TaxID=3483 RepID=A0A803NHN7_CANSA
MVAKHLWALSSKQDNICVKWINSMNLKDQDVWSCPIKLDLSWYFKKLLKIRNVTNIGMLNQATKGNKFKVSRFYIELIGAAKTSYAATVWHKFIVPKHKFIFWQIINEQLLTQDLLSRFLPIPSELWAVCEDASETHSHLFMDCIFTRKLIDWVKNWAGNLSWPKSISDLQERLFPAKPDLALLILNAVFSTTLYQLWRNRNDSL